jgi:hypothetical protein
VNEFGSSGSFHTVSAHSARNVQPAQEQTRKANRPASSADGAAEARTGAERTTVREHRTGTEAQPGAEIAGRAINPPQTHQPT